MCTPKEKELEEVKILEQRIAKKEIEHKEVLKKLKEADAVSDSAITMPIISNT